MEKVEIQVAIAYIIGLFAFIGVFYFLVWIKPKEKGIPRMKNISPPPEKPFEIDRELQSRIAEQKKVERREDEVQKFLAGSQSDMGLIVNLLKENTDALKANTELNTFLLTAIENLEMTIRNK